MEIVKSKLITRITLFLAFTFLFGACAFAQELGVVRYDSYDAVINKYVKTRVASYGIEFTLNKKSSEDFYIGVSCDSVSSTVESPLLYAYIPKNINPKNVDLWIQFEDGTKELFKQIRYKEDGYVEYQITAKTYRKLKTLKYKYIEFSGLGMYVSLFENDYFVKFFKLIG